MNNVITFSSSTNFGLAEAIVYHGWHNDAPHAIDTEKQVIWTSNAAAFIAAFDLNGLDPEEYTVAEGSKADYSKLLKRLEAKAAAEAAAEAAKEAVEEFADVE